MSGVVALGGVENTTAVQLQGAGSFYLVAIVVSACPMGKGKYKGKEKGFRTDVWRL